MTRHKRALYLEATHQQLDMKSDMHDSHKTTGVSARRHSEADVKSLVAAFKDFENPFEVTEQSHDLLHCLSSGIPASSGIAQDLLSCIKRGKQAAEDFMEQRLLSKQVDFHLPIKKLKLQTFQSMAVQKSVTSAQQKAVQVKAEWNFLGQLLLWSQEQNISFYKLFTFPLSPVPWSLVTANGSTFVKTDKSQLLHLLEAESAPQENALPDDCVFIVDGNAILHSFTKHLPETFHDRAWSVFQCLRNGNVVHFVTDSYHLGSIKAVERARRGDSLPYIIGAPKTKVLRDFPSFLRNSTNKQQLLRFILSEWQTPKYAKHLQARLVYYTSEQDCTNLQSHDGINVMASPVKQLKSSQKEADTRIILHCVYASQKPSDHVTIVVRTPDVDVFLLLLAYCGKMPNSLLMFDTGTSFRECCSRCRFQPYDCVIIRFVE